MGVSNPGNRRQWGDTRAVCEKVREKREALLILTTVSSRHVLQNSPFPQFSTIHAPCAPASAQAVLSETLRLSAVSRGTVS